ARLVRRTSPVPVAVAVTLAPSASVTNTPPAPADAVTVVACVWTLADAVPTPLAADRLTAGATKLPPADWTTSPAPVTVTELLAVTAPPAVSVAGPEIVRSPATVVPLATVSEPVADTVADTPAVRPARESVPSPS